MHVFREIIKKVKSVNRKRIRYCRSVKFWLSCQVIDLLLNNRMVKNGQSTFNPKSIKKILFLRHDNKIGDSIVASGLVRALQEAGIQVDVLVGDSNAFIYGCDDFKGKIFRYNYKDWHAYKLAFELQKQRYDMLLDLSEEISVNHYAWINSIRAVYTLGLNKEKFKCYNLNIPFIFPDKHISEKFIAVLAVLKLPSRKYCYQLTIPINIEKDTLQFIHSLPQTNKIVINTSGACQSRILSQNQINFMIEKIKLIQADATIIIIGSTLELERILLPEGVYLNPFESYYSAAVIVKNAGLLISPDTSWVHVAHIYNTPLIALYGSATTFDGFNNNKVWAPNYAQATQIITTERNISSISNDDIGVEIERHMQMISRFN